MESKVKTFTLTWGYVEIAHRLRLAQLYRMIDEANKRAAASGDVLESSLRNGK